MSAVRRVLVVMDPPERIRAARDSSVALMLSAQQRGAEISITTPEQLHSTAQGVRARVTQIEVRDQDAWWQEQAQTLVPLTHFDVVLMRKDPPVDLAYFATTWLLEQAQRDGVCVLNAPRALREWNEKLAIAQFPELTPPFLVSAQQEALMDFLKEQGELVLKPLDRMGGAFVYHLRQNDPNLAPIMEMMTQEGTMPVMVQRFIPEVVQGDRRLLLIDGALVPSVAVRIPKDGEFRANLSRGARLQVEPANERDREIADQVSAPLREAGVYFAGLDVVGGWLTEINITSPTCIREVEAATGYPVSMDFWDAVEERG